MYFFVNQIYAGIFQSVTVFHILRLYGVLPMANW